ncbi:MAG: rod shape-determining protein MreD [Defluviitaleaceae bacterium]|nr:rod shape-determining protein MreD [Defluviitaleaceae bacterium]
MRIFIIGLVLVASVLLETTMVSRMAIFGIAPDLMLCVIVSYSILRGETEGACAGFAGGLLMDIAIGQAMGLFAMLGLLAGYFAGKPFRDFYRESYMLPMFITGIAAFAQGFALYLFNVLTIAHIGMFAHILAVILPVTFYTMIISVFVYRSLYAVNSLVELYERRSHKIFNK